MYFSALRIRIIIFALATFAASLTPAGNAAVADTSAELDSPADYFTDPYTNLTWVDQRRADKAFWPKVLNAVLMNRPEAIRMLSGHTSRGNLAADGLCYRQRKCLYKKLKGSDPDFALKWYGLTPQSQLLLYLTTTGQHFTPWNLAPIWAQLGEKNTTALAERMMWIYGYPPGKTCVPDANGVNPEPCKYDIKAWPVILRRETGKSCSPCYANGALHSWKDRPIEKQVKSLWSMEEEDWDSTDYYVPDN